MNCKLFEKPYIFNCVLTKFWKLKFFFLFIRNFKVLCFPIKLSNINDIRPKLNLLKNLEIIENLPEYFGISFLHRVKRKSKIFNRSFWPHQHFSGHIKIPLVSNWLCPVPFDRLNFYLVINWLLFFISFFIFLFLFVFFILNIFLGPHPWNINNSWVLLFYNFCKLILFQITICSKIYCVWVNFFFENIPF